MGVPLYTQEIPHTVNYGCAVRACELCIQEQSMDHISPKKGRPTCYVAFFSGPPSFASLAVWQATKIWAGLACSTASNGKLGRAWKWGYMLRSSTAQDVFQSMCTKHHTGKLEMAISCVLILGKKEHFLVLHMYTYLSSSHRFSLCNHWVDISSHNRAQPADSPSAHIPLHASTTWTFCAKWAQEFHSRATDSGGHWPGKILKTVVSFEYKGLDTINKYATVNGVASGLLVKALDCGSKGLEFQSHLQQRFISQRFISLPCALSPTPKIE